MFRRLDFIIQLNPISYVFDASTFDTFVGIPDSLRYYSSATATPRQNGFIAQDVEKIVKDSGYAFYGVEKPQNEKDLYAIRYAEFVIPLVKAVQELTAKLETQQSMIDVLSYQVDLLKGDSSETEFSEKATLFQNTPNPFSLETKIRVSLPETTRRLMFLFTIWKARNLNLWRSGVVGMK